MKKVKVYLSVINTEIGRIPVLSNFQTVNRSLTIYTAEKKEGQGVSSIFFIVRGKDAKALENAGYQIKSIVLHLGNKARLIDYNNGSGTVLEQSFLY